MGSPTAQLQLLGDFHLVYGDGPVTGVDTPRLQALLAYLALHRSVPQPRRHVAFVFWPESAEPQAHNNLRQTLHQLRRALGGAGSVLQADARTIGWAAAVPLTLDVTAFEQALDAADAAERGRHLPALRTASEQAAALYRGDMLPNCYDEWIAPLRTGLRERYLAALRRLVRLLEAERDYPAAVRYARQVLAGDPLDEETYRVLMRLLALAQDRAGALEVYRTCAGVLERELGVTPEAATRAIYERLLRAEPVGAEPAVSLHSDLAASTLIGRAPEWGRLIEAWQRATAGAPTFVLLTGEAGVGKSRLAEEFVAWASRQGIVAATTRSYAAEGRLSFAPVAAWLRHPRLYPHVARLDAPWIGEVARILPELGSARPELTGPEPITEAGRRLWFFEALARAVLAGPLPLLLFVDDLQWCDPETLEWLHFLLRFDPAAPLLVVGTARAEEMPPAHPLHRLVRALRRLAAVIEIPLAPLDLAETSKLATQVAGHPWDVPALLALHRETAGYPLFVVETIRAGLMPAAEPAHTPGVPRLPPADASALPPRVYAVLAGRLAQLAPETCAVAELAAVAGREFSVDLLVAAGAQRAEAVVRALDELWYARIVREVGAGSYDFTHDKLREVAYAEISPPQRRLLHRQLADALQTRPPAECDRVSGQIAAHYERAGLPERAIPYYARAAAMAQQVYANDDACGLLERALALVGALPDSDRDRQELALLLALAPVYRITRGWTAPELERLLNRALALSEQVGDDAGRAQVLYGLQSLTLVQGHLDRVETLCDTLQNLYQGALGTPAPPMAAMMRAGARLHLGRPALARDELEQIIAAQDASQLQHLQESQGVNYLTHARAWQAHALWCLGYPDQALARGQEAVRLARDLGQPFNQALVSAYLAMLQQMRADPATARAAADEAFALTEAFQAPYYHNWAAILVCAAAAWDTPDEAHIAALRTAIAQFTEPGARLRLPYFFALLARVYGRAERTTAGLAAVDEGLAAARTYKEHWWDAELQRLRAELLHAQGIPPAAVEAPLHRAISIARAQNARALELRTLLSLVQLGSSGSQARAIARLQDLTAWFREGADTPDLQAARAILA